MFYILLFGTLIVVMGLSAVALDRLNFEQKPFKPETLDPDEEYFEDRLGVQITEED